MIDRIVAFVLIIILLPFIFMISLISVFLGHIPVIFKSTRLGKNKKPFTIYKFSTLHSWTEQQFMDFLHKHPECKTEWQKYGKLRKDPRSGKYGKILRHFSLDEIPQLWNVVKGEMALVGPRPIDIREDIIYGKYSELLHSIKPGITGLWQVMGRNTITYPRRVAINIYYVKNKSLPLDLWILYKTFWAIIGGKGAY